MSDQPVISPRRKWAAVGLGTFIGLVAYWGAVLTLATPIDETQDAPEASGVLALAMLLVPVAFFAVAFVSERPHRWWGSFAATGVAGATGILAALLARDLATAVVAGLGMGGAVALHPDREGWLARRGLGVAVAAVYVAVLIRVTPLLAVLMAPLLPFLAVGVADTFAERAASRRSAADSP
jgi:hypothetical protein